MTDDAIPYIPVTMIRPDLEKIPSAPLPEGYRFRFYQPGDEKTWVRIWRAAEVHENITVARFGQQFADHANQLPRRMLFLDAPEGESCGTITAWPQASYHGRRFGRIHWVALTPAHQGKGLAKPMMTETLRLMRRLGHRRAMLVTQTTRIPAISLYLKYGFVPDMQAPRAAEAWPHVAKRLDHPALRKAVRNAD